MSEPKLQDLSVREVQGIGPQKAKELEDFGIRTVEDLIHYYPFRYDDMRLKELSEAADGDKVTVQGSVYGQPNLQMYGRKKSRLTCKMMVDRFFVTAVWFNRAYVRNQLQPGRTIVLTGKWDKRRLQLTVSTHEFPESGPAQSGRLQPVYSVGGSLTQRWMRTAIHRALEQYGGQVEEILPPSLIRKHDLVSRKMAVYALHHPEDNRESLKARERMAYEELFLYQLKLQSFRAVNRSRSEGTAQALDMPEVRRFVRNLPFTLTGSQKTAIAEVVRDMQDKAVMNRLLQGDVGAGKTLVAAVALYATIKAGYQGVLMVPTEILAEQHLRSLEKLYADESIQLGLLTGSLTQRQRRDMLAALQFGLVDLVVGTHALIQEDVFFQKLGLIVIDEQHRFGVAQRAVLRRKGWNPDVLTMTATPIPRTLAITAYGDMDVSTLKELPKGRKTIKTYWVRHELFERVIGFIRRELGAGRQGYAICPLIEESDKLDVQNAVELYEQLAAALSEFRIGLLHGRLPQQEKEAVMRDFLLNRIHFLVSTTVIEVGVDVPNATLMIINDADRFGLSQLHQLRGRVGRGKHQSFCILIADPKSEVGEMRMKAMAETGDGFEIARRDLELRGPGDFFGTKQSGAPDFKVADLMQDFALLEKARDDAAALVQDPAFWTSAEYMSLREYLQREQVLEGEALD